VIVLVLPLGAAFYRYYYTQNYDYILEAPCDPVKEVCYTRDCAIVECPPNGLSNYKVFFVKAYNFVKCSDNSCAKECEAGLIACVSVPCGESENDDCTDINTN
jgi:hypothetical protein